jgi:hypothetical protein
MKVFLMLLLVSITNFAFGCLSASQNRVFPIGTIGNKVIVAEFRLSRSDGVELSEPRWRGVNYIKAYDANMMELSSIIVDSLGFFNDSLYLKVVSTSFKIAVEKARQTFPELVIANFNSLQHCDYQFSCFEYSLIFDSVSRKISIQIEDPKLYEISVLRDSTSIAESVYSQANEYRESDLFDYLNRNLYISSVRTYIIGSQKVFVFHLGNGHVFESVNGGFYPPGTKQSNSDFNPQNIENSVFINPVLHHGNGFDFIIVVD